MDNDLLQFIEKYSNKSEVYGADELEIFAQITESVSLQSIQGYVTTRSGIDSGIAVRAVVGKSVGFSSASGIGDIILEKTIRDAVKIARVKPEDPHFNGLPDAMDLPRNAGAYDPNLAGLSIDEVVKLSNELEKSARERSPNVKKVEISMSRSVEQFFISNSRGVLDSDKGTFFTAWVEVKAKRDGSETSGLEFVTDRRFDQERIYQMGTGASDRAVKMFDSRKLNESFKGDLLVENKLVYSFLIPLEYNVSALNVQENRSVWKDKKGSKVASDLLTIYDNGGDKYGFLTSKVDGEGVPMQNKVLIEKGELKNFIYDSYTAKKEGVKSTGNAIRRSYNNPPSLSCVNIVIERGNKSLNELVENIDKGVFATTFLMGSHMTNPIKGFFSMTSINSFYIENGEIKYPIKSVNISGNFFEAIKRIKAVGNDIFKHYKGSFPSIVISDISFV